MSENIDIITRKENIVAIADAVRAKNGTTAEMTLGEIVSGIEGIQAGGSGGSGVETCTVTISEGGNLFGFVYTRLLYDVTIPWYVINDGNNIVWDNYQISDIVKGSSIFFLTSDRVEMVQGGALMNFSVEPPFSGIYVTGAFIGSDCSIIITTT